jgi:hypothetical protein
MVLNRTNDISALRLQSQRLSCLSNESPSSLISWLGGIQAQDFAGSMWALGIRSTDNNEKNIEQAFARKELIRTWAMRGTLHLVSAGDIRWLLTLLGARLLKGSLPRNLQLGLDGSTLNRTNEILLLALQGGKQLTRSELRTVFAENGIDADGVRFYHIMWHAALKQLVCYGLKRGGEFTFALLDECVPEGHSLSRDESLTELAKRYFLSRGPATLDDFIWWSGLTITDARTALGGAMPHLKKIVFSDQVYWIDRDHPDNGMPAKTAFLLPPFDEFLVAYKDRSTALDPRLKKIIISRNGIFYPVVLLEGRVAGIWKRSFKKDKITIEISTESTFSASSRKTILAAANLYSQFHGKELAELKVK